MNVLKKNCVLEYFSNYFQFTVVLLLFISGFFTSKITKCVSSDQFSDFEGTEMN